MRGGGRSRGKCLGAANHRTCFRVYMLEVPVYIQTKTRSCGGRPRLTMAVLRESSSRGAGVAMSCTLFVLFFTFVYVQKAVVTLRIFFFIMEGDGMVFLGGFLALLQLHNLNVHTRVQAGRAGRCHVLPRGLRFCVRSSAISASDACLRKGGSKQRGGWGSKPLCRSGLNGSWKGMTGETAGIKGLSSM